MEPSPPLDPGSAARKFAELLQKPPLMADPVFPQQNYLEKFGELMFKRLAHECWHQPEMAQAVKFNGGDNVKAMFLAGWTGFWAFDFEEKTKQGWVGKDIFLDCVKDPIRRPPPNMAAFTAEHHILIKGAHQIQIATGNSLPGQYEVCRLKTVGWYVAKIVFPKPNQP